MAILTDKVRKGLEFLNYNYEKYFVSKFLGNLLLGREVSGCYYTAPSISQQRREPGLETKILNMLSGLVGRGPKTEILETSLTKKYREKEWSIDRIVLDTVSNHLPADSRGTIVKIEYQQDGKWVDFREYDKARLVEAIRVRDDGEGYEYTALGLLDSDKTDEGKSVGQFGEGLKLVATACLREGINVEYSSEDWSAQPYTKERVRKGRKIHQLCFRVEKGKPVRQGSLTIFDNPKSALVEKFDELSDDMLLFNTKRVEVKGEDGKVTEQEVPDYEVLHTKDYSASNLYSPRIIDLKKDRTNLFIKGLRVKNGCGFHSALLGGFFASNSGFNSIFSYDLGIDDISPDRQIADYGAVRRSIKSLIESCENTRVRRRILMMAYAHPDENFEEYDALSYSEDKRFDRRDPYLGFEREQGILHIGEFNLFASSNKKRWKQVFHEAFGEKAILYSPSDLDANKDAAAMGYAVVKLNSALSSYLTSTIGIESASDLFKKKREIEWVDDENLTNEERALLGVIPEINRIVLGHDLDVNVSVYEGEYMVTEGPTGHLRTGEEVTSSRGFYKKEDPRDLSRDVMGIKRSELETKQKFISTYLHELGHKVTEQGDYERPFTNFFVEALAKLTNYCMEHDVVLQ